MNEVGRTVVVYAISDYIMTCEMVRRIDVDDKSIRQNATTNNITNNMSLLVEYMIYVGLQ